MTYTLESIEGKLALPLENLSMEAVWQFLDWNGLSLGRLPTDPTGAFIAAPEVCAAIADTMDAHRTRQSWSIAFDDDWVDVIAFCRRCIALGGLRLTIDAEELATLRLYEAYASYWKYEQRCEGIPIYDELVVHFQAIADATAAYDALHPRTTTADKVAILRNALVSEPPRAF